MLFRKLILTTLLSLLSNLLVNLGTWEKIQENSISWNITLEKKFAYSLSVWRNKKGSNDEAWSLIFTPPHPQADLFRFFTKPVANKLKGPMILKSAFELIKHNAVPPDVEIIDLKATARFASEEQVGPGLILPIKGPASKEEGTSF
ncbi:hypothetical protein BDP27DRAFT_1361782 [Rhodocollybia butyracea]|uniref:Uncharacterized protein n=1 Tax=Rhodocollybia butyracea TaxID=206335 RepID=A0A9P5PSE5_9AGAR|nr:hypothetical protein BDP27DRAFT_1361782 [Rhodocollybia butyracea]